MRQLAQKGKLQLQNASRVNEANHVLHQMILLQYEPRIA